MNLKVKSSLIIIVTFVIGMILGIILTQSLYPPPKMIDKISILRSRGGFMERFERIIQPNEVQKEKIREILEIHFERMHSQSKKFRDQFVELNDSLRTELEPILNDEQKERLEKMTERFREHDRPGFGPRPRHPKRKFPKGSRRQQ
jgi:hypothetical protein